MGVAASGVCVEGTDVGQIAEPIPDDHHLQSDTAQQCCPFLQKGV